MDRFIIPFVISKFFYHITCYFRMSGINVLPIETEKK